MEAEGMEEGGEGEDEVEVDFLYKKDITW